jgi:uncharacterized RDD family membrane protein YckC
MERLMAQQPPLKSPDGQWFWDGSRWRSLISADGQRLWDGSAWAPLPPGTVASTPPDDPAASGSGPPTPPPPPAPPADQPPGTEPRPGWLPADAPWPPPTHEASPPMVPGPPPPPVDWAARREEAFGAPAYSGVRYAGFWIRFLAAFIDGLIISVPLFLIGFALNAGNISAALANQSNGGPPTAVSTPLNGLWLVFSFLYFSYFWSQGSTPGMRIFGLQVVDANNQAQIGFGRAALRYVGYLISSFCCYIGLIWAAFDSRKQGWHDKIATTLVVYR